MAEAGLAGFTDDDLPYGKFEEMMLECGELLRNEHSPAERTRREYALRQRVVDLLTISLGALYVKLDEAQYDRFGGDNVVLTQHIRTIIARETANKIHDPSVKAQVPTRATRNRRKPGTTRRHSTASSGDQRRKAEERMHQNIIDHRAAVHRALVSNYENFRLGVSQPVPEMVHCVDTEPLTSDPAHRSRRGFFHAARKFFGRIVHCRSNPADRH